ncbi:hypothetical protein [Carnobacterium maltaromaticum]|nr:hypothetical protein [Carnobacterium maltaromaticum]
MKTIHAQGVIRFYQDSGEMQWRFAKSFIEILSLLQRQLIVWLDWK